MAQTTKKKKMSMKRIKRIAKNVFKEIGEAFKSIYDKFMSLPKHIKTICSVWVIVILLIIVIVFASTSNKKYLEDYGNIEQLLIDASVEYLKKNDIYPVMGSRLKLDTDTLKEFSSLDAKELDNNKCKGFTLSYYDDDKDEYVVRPYISCKKYVTKDYNDFK